jgi:SpoVK/Ycf46/Vps4 family AAA+-type ATPase
MSAHMTKVLYNTTSFSNSFVAVAEHIMKNCMSDPDLSKISECAFQLHSGTVSDRHADKLNDMLQSGDYDIDKADIKEHDSRCGVYFIEQTSQITLDKEKEIYCAVRSEVSVKEKKDDISENEVTTIYFDLYSYTSSLLEIKEFVDGLCTNYLKREEDMRNNKRYVYTYDQEGMWDETEFISTKSFDNLFFEGKEEVIKKIDFFLNNREWYEKNGIPYTLGIGLYGPPGTGKTSFIKAIANYVNRHVVAMPLKLAKTKSALENMYYEDTYSKHTIPFDKKIMVLEDIDCVGKFVFQRKESENKWALNDDQCEEDEEDEEEYNAGRQNRRKNSNNKKNKKTVSINEENIPTLDDLLNLIDGIRENSGRILIITSNFYNKLDTALVRPGRVDITLKMDNASRQTISQMYERYYGDKLDPAVIDQIPDRKFSTAEIVNFYVGNTESKEGFIQCLVKGTDEINEDHKEIKHKNI